MRSELEPYGSLEHYMNPEDKAKFLADITETVEWLYGDGENAPLIDYQERLKKFNGLGEPTKMRKHFHDSLPT